MPKPYYNKNFKRLTTGPPVNAVKYRGPVVVNKVADSTVVVNITTVGSYTVTLSGGAGFGATVYPASLVTSLSDYSDNAALYQEFRVLGIRVEFVPQFQGYPPGQVWTNGDDEVFSSNWTPFYMAPYHGDATAFSSQANAFQHYGVSYKSVNMPHSATVKMSETDEAQWFSTTSGTTPIMGIKTYFGISGSAGGSGAVNLGTILVSFNLQFKGRVASATQFKSNLGVVDKKDEKATVSVFSDKSYLELPQLKREEFVLVDQKEYQLMKAEKEKQKKPG